jgi:hypothetical protein
MTNVLTALGAAAGLALFLIMAVVPLLVDLPERGERPRPAPEPVRQRPVPMPVPAQRTSSGAERCVATARRPVGPRA